MSDSTPFYSELYHERISLRTVSSKNEAMERTFHSDNENQKHILSSRATLDVTKYALFDESFLLKDIINQSFYSITFFCLFFFSDTYLSSKT